MEGVNYEGLSGLDIFSQQDLSITDAVLRYLDKPGYRLRNIWRLNIDFADAEIMFADYLH